MNYGAVAAHDRRYNEQLARARGARAAAAAGSTRARRSLDAQYSLRAAAGVTTSPGLRQSRHSDWQRSSQAESSAASIASVRMPCDADVGGTLIHQFGLATRPDSPLYSTCGSSPSSLLGAPHTGLMYTLCTMLSPRCTSEQLAADCSVEAEASACSASRAHLEGDISQADEELTADEMERSNAASLSTLRRYLSRGRSSLQSWEALPQENFQCSQGA